MGDILIYDIYSANVQDGEYDTAYCDWLERAFDSFEEANLIMIWTMCNV